MNFYRYQYSSNNLTSPQKIITLFCFGVFCLMGFGQDSVYEVKSLGLFESEAVLSVALEYSKKELRHKTNDTTYMDSRLRYKASSGSWDTLNVKLRSRGNFRKKTCYFTPLKLKIKKHHSKATIFEGQKLLKVVMPCLNESGMNDNILKEYLIYKMYEIVSPYNFKTRLIDLEYSDLRRRKTKTYQFTGFLVEDDSKMAKRLDAKVAKRKVYPQGYDDLSAVRNAMFNYMVGNTDFSTTNSHNCKPIYLEKKFIPVAYDFDLAGFVNTSYSIVSETRKEPLPIEKVTQRYYMGYKRDYNYFRQIRQEYIEKESEILNMLEAHRTLFESQNSYDIAKDYIEDFFEFVKNEKKFKQYTYDKALALN